MAQRRDPGAEWRARPPTVRAWVALAVVTSILGIAFRPGPGLVLSLLFTGLLVWGVWEGYRIAWIFALIGAVLPLVSILSVGFRLASPSVVYLVVSGALLIAPSTQEWVKRQEVRRGYGPGGGPSRRTAA